MKQKPSLIAEIDMDKDIKSILYNSKYVGMVLDNEDAENPYELVIYDTKGKKVSSTPFNFSYNGIKFSDKSVVVYNDTSMRVYTVGGKLRYEGDIEGGISSIITKDKDYTYYIVGSTTIRDIKLK